MLSQGNDFRRAILLWSLMVSEPRMRSCHVCTFSRVTSECCQHSCDIVPQTALLARVPKRILRLEILSCPVQKC